MIGVEWAEKGWIPDPLVRFGVRGMLRKRLREEEDRAAGAPAAAAEAWREEMRKSPIALVPREANRQHYELAPELFEAVLGPRLKYSCCYWPAGVASLAAAEEAMLELSCERAGLRDGMSILDLGCGWGSLALFAAERLPGATVLAVSNSRPQREFVLRRAAERGLRNLEVVTADMNDFDPGRRFDRVVSIEMFEHMRNWPLLLERIAGWLEPDGRLFLHVFCHRTLSYPYEDRGGDDWMARHFFTGGMMPSEHLIREFSSDLEVEAQWRVGGEHYERTSRAWLRRLDAAGPELDDALVRTYGARDARVWRQRWRLFFIACEVLFGHGHGREWYVTHALLRRSGSA